MLCNGMRSKNALENETRFYKGTAITIENKECGPDDTALRVRLSYTYPQTLVVRATEHANRLSTNLNLTAVLLVLSYPDAITMVGSVTPVGASANTSLGCLSIPHRCETRVKLMEVSGGEARNVQCCRSTHHQRHTSMICWARNGTTTKVILRSRLYNNRSDHVHEPSTIWVTC